MTVSEADQVAFAAMLGDMEAAWNAGDGAAFGARMADDADFVTIRADHLRGRDAIVASHTGIFSTIYAGSRNRISLEGARMLGAELALIHARSLLEAPCGPLAGQHGARFSLVLTRGDAEWELASFHITLEPDFAAGSPAHA